MKKLIALILTILSIGYTSAQAPAIEWQKSLGGTADDFARSIQPTSDGGYVVAGYSNSTDVDIAGNNGSYDYWVVKLDATGNIQWQKSLGGSNSDVGYSIQTTSDGGYIIAGLTNSNDGNVTGNNGNADYWVVKLDATGNIQWQKSLGGSSSDYAYSIQITSDGGYIVAGQSTSTNGNVTGNHGAQDYWVVKLDATGNIQWQKSLGGSGADYGRSIQTSSDGGYIVAGFSYSNDGNVTGNHGLEDYWVVKLDATGNIEWQKSFGGSGDDLAQSIQITLDGGCIVAGQSNSIDGDVTGNHGDIDYWVVKLDAVGTIQWQKSLGGTNADISFSVQTTFDGGYIIAGNGASTDGNTTENHGAQDYWVVKLDAAGTLQWQKSLGGTSNDFAQSVQTTSDGGYVVAGISNSTDGNVTGNKGLRDFWIVKLGPDLAISTFNKEAIVIYPNPVCDEFHIQTPTNTIITKTTILDINGKVVFEQTQNSNVINVENLAQGIYILEAYSGDDKYTSKFVKE